MSTALYPVFSNGKVNIVLNLPNTRYLNLLVTFEMCLSYLKYWSSIVLEISDPRHSYYSIAIPQSCRSITLVCVYGDSSYVRHIVFITPKCYAVRFAVANC